MTLNQQYSALVESLRLVVAPAETQVKVVPDFASPTDEVATSFGDAFLLLPQLETAGKVSKSAGTSIKKLDSWFSKMPADGSIASPESLEKHEFWMAARKLAADALEQLGEEVKEPNLSDITWLEE